MPHHFQNFQSLPYNSKLKGFAKNNRKAGNLCEAKLWKKLKNKQTFGLDFDRQKVIGNYIADFYNADYQIVIEIDGYSHDEDKDKMRDEYMNKLGIEVIRVSYEEMRYDFGSGYDYICDKILNRLQKCKKTIK